MHEGAKVTAMRRKGKKTDISRQNDERKAYNVQAQQEKEQSKSELLANAQSSLQVRLAERAAQRGQERQRAEQERQAQKKQHSIGFER